MINMEEIITHKLNSYLKSIENLQPTDTDYFFYTRLKVKMDKKNEQLFLSFNIKPAWAIVCLMIFFCLNSYIILTNKKEKGNTVFVKPTIESFATDYDQTITLY